MLDAIFYILMGASITAAVMAIVAFVVTRRTHGTLHIDRSNPTKDIYSLDFNINLDELPNYERVIFKVETRNNPVL